MGIIIGLTDSTDMLQPQEGRNVVVPLLPEIIKEEGTNWPRRHVSTEDTSLICRSTSTPRPGF